MQQRLANKIPHEIREQLLDWIPQSKPNMANPEFKFLWDMYFIYIDPDAIKQSNCPICWGNVRKNWVAMIPFLQTAEQNFLLLEAL